MAMNGRFSVFLLLFGLAIGGCGGATDEMDPTGTWVGQTAVVGWKGGGFREMWTFKDGTITVERRDEVYTYQLDASKEPKRIDITPGPPSGDGKVRLGIYKIEDDILTICSLIPGKAKPDANRPEDFDPTKRDDVVVLTFRRKR
jgi:uncharacterized protein (TIGR03067 family)